MLSAKGQVLLKQLRTTLPPWTQPVIKHKYAFTSASLADESYENDMTLGLSL